MRILRPNPQHVIIYGTTERGEDGGCTLVMCWRKPKAIPLSPFGPDVKFVEIDATTARFDDRGIADSLLAQCTTRFTKEPGHGDGRHPAAEARAMTKAHGGDAVHRRNGELHPVQ